jgi:hypothetical protein
VLTALLRSQPDVRDRLFQCVAQSPRPLVVAQEHDLDFGGPFERRQPYRYLLEHGAQLSIVLVADDGHEGLWRDPMGDLCEQHFDDPGDIAAAAGGYLLFREGLDPTYVKRDLWDPLNDVRTLIARLRLPIAPPEKPQAEPSPRHRRATDGRSEDEIETDPGQASRARPPADGGPRRRPRPAADARAETPPPPPPEPAAPPEPDAFAVLGVPPTADEDAVKKAFRALVVQYHPDKVAHLAPEFRALAEEKTRALTAAYEAAQRILRGEKPSHG